MSPTAGGSPSTRASTDSTRNTADTMRQGNTHSSPSRMARIESARATASSRCDSNTLQAARSMPKAMPPGPLATSHHHDNAPQGRATTVATLRR